jgi:hypothetical protein
LHDERGQVAWSVLLLVLGLLMLAGLALDAGVWFFHHRAAQNQVDAAAAAAVLELPTSDTSASGPAAAAAIDWLKNNGVGTTVADGATIVTATNGSVTANCKAANMAGNTARIVFMSESGSAPYDKIGVCVRLNSGVFLSGLAGISSSRVSAAAKAEVIPPEPVPFTLMALNVENQCDALLVAGNSNVDITGGSSYTGGNCNTSCPSSRGTLHLNGDNSFLTMTGGSHYVVDGTCGVFDNFDHITPEPVINQPSITDPFASFVQPPINLAVVCVPGPLCNVTCVAPLTSSWAPDTAYCCPSNTAPYCNSGTLTIPSGETVSLSAGVYVFPQGLSVDGSMTGSNVLLYGTCAAVQAATKTCCPTYPGTCTNSAPAALRFQSTGILNLSGRSGRSNVLFEMDRTAPAASRPDCDPQPGPNAAGTISFSGSQPDKLTNTSGVVYAVASTVTFSGVAGSNGGDIAVLADKICLSGQAELGGQDIQAPPPGEFEYYLTE